MSGIKIENQDAPNAQVTDHRDRGCVQSGTLKDLGGAWCKAKLEMGSSVALDKKNPHLRSEYASLSAILNKGNPIFAKHNLTVLQMPGYGDLMTQLIHSPSGQFVVFRTPLINPKGDMQGYGAAVTYARKYALISLCGVSGDEDCDGESIKNEANKSNSTSNYAGPYKNNKKQPPPKEEF